MKYIEGMCRNEQDKVRSHLYVVIDQDMYPMCGYGWNRSDGEGFSIFRGNHSARGTCKICEKRAALNLEPIKDGWPHKTKWI